MLEPAEWKKAKVQHVQDFTGYTITPAKKRERGRQVGSYTYWFESVRRLSVLADDWPTINSGFIIDGRIDPVTRSTVKRVLDKFMEGYKDSNKEPFNERQLNEMYRIINGGLLIEVPE